MKCPKCKTELIKGEAKAYETLMEHVSDPNSQDMTKRATYKCPNNCYGKDAFWGIYGGAYCTDRDKGYCNIDLGEVFGKKEESK